MPTNDRNILQESKLKNISFHTLEKKDSHDAFLVHITDKHTHHFQTPCSNDRQATLTQKIFEKHISLKSQ